MSVVKRRVIPESFKREAVDQVVSSWLSAGKVAIELGLHETVLRRWMTEFGTQATRSPRRSSTQAAAPSPSYLVAEVARLRRDNDRLRMMCAVMGLSASGYYAWRIRPESRRAASNRALLDDIRLIHAESSGAYGSPRGTPLCVATAAVSDAPGSSV